MQHLGGYNSVHHISPNHRASQWWSWGVHPDSLPLLMILPTAVCGTSPSHLHLILCPRKMALCNYPLHKVKGTKKPEYGQNGQKGSRNAKSVKSRKTDSWKGKKCSSHSNLFFHGLESSPCRHDAGFAVTAGNSSILSNGEEGPGDDQCFLY